MNLKTLQLLFIALMMLLIFALVLKYEVAEALIPEADIPGVCEKYHWPTREREVCDMADGAPCLTLWGMWLMADNEKKRVQKVIAEKYVKRGCLYGAF